MPIYFSRRFPLLDLLLIMAILWFCQLSARAEKNPTVAIDIVLKPDAVMSQRAHQANTELLKVCPTGFALDASHHAHITLLQLYVKSAELNKVYEATGRVVAKENPTAWKLEAFKYYYGKMGETGLAGIVLKPTPDLLRLQKELIEALAPYSLPTGQEDAFVTTKEEPEVDQFTINFVGSFVQKASGEKFNPHVTTGIGPVKYLDNLLAQPFQPFTFSASGVCVYQLGSYGTARKVLKNLP
jgi:hypothetical protein